MRQFYPTALLLALLLCTPGLVARGQQLTAGGAAVSVPLPASVDDGAAATTTEHAVPDAASAAAALEQVTEIDAAAAAAAVQKMAAAARAIPVDAPQPPPSNVKLFIDPSGGRRNRAADPPAIQALSAAKVAPQGVACKPYSYVYAWCGLAPTDSPPADTKDFVGVIDALPSSPTFGKLLRTVNTPFSWTEPHHCHVDATGKWFGAGGLLSFLQAADNVPDVMMFDVSNPAVPRYSHGFQLAIGGCTDEFRALSTGGFAVSSMCGRDGSVGGGWFKIKGAKMNAVTQYQLPAGLDRSSYDPHGIDVDETWDRVLTSDYFNVATTIIKDMNNPPAIQTHTTMRVWKYSTGQHLGTITIANRSMADGMMDTRRVPNTKAQFWVTNGLGMFYWVDAWNLKAQLAYCVNPGCKPQPGNCINSNVWSNGRRMLLAVFALSQVRLLDTTNPKAPKTLDSLQLPQGSGGHSIKYDETTGIAALATYFLDVNNKKFGLDTTLDYQSDRKIHLMKIDSVRDKIIYKSAVDFNTAVPSKGPANCHGIAFNTGFSTLT